MCGGGVENFRNRSEDVGNIIWQYEAVSDCFLVRASERSEAPRGTWAV